MSEVHVEERSLPIKTPKQLITVILLSLLVLIAIIVLLSQLLTIDIDTDKDHPALSDEAVAARIKPAGQVEVTDPNAPKVEKSGQEIVEAVCGVCHATGALNALKIGDQAAWAPHLGMGLEHLTQMAIKGVRQMPPRGGSPDLTDIEIARAVAYMANQSGARFKEPAAPSATAKADAKGKVK